MIVNNSNDFFCSFLTPLFEFSTLILSLVCYIELFIVYANEDCGDLTTLILVYIIISSIGICLFLLIVVGGLLFYLCLFSFALIMKCCIPDSPKPESQISHFPFGDFQNEENIPEPIQNKMESIELNNQIIKN